MIDPKELRIGNWIKSIAQGDIQVKASDIADIEKIETVFLKGQDYFQPIPLTHEWLERLGFKYTDTPDDDYSKNGITIYGSPFEDYWRVEQINHIGMGQKPPKIKYVHQLQNLFFALTGEEL